MGGANALLYAPAAVNGSVDAQLDSNAFMVEADWVPFGKSDSISAPWVNLKVGIQAIAYTKFNGGTTSYDGFGRSANANDTIFLFSWLAFVARRVRFVNLSTPLTCRTTINRSAAGSTLMANRSPSSIYGAPRPNLRPSPMS